jgi:ribosomal-protein-alanine N-acetyltransferase
MKIRLASPVDLPQLVDISQAAACAAQWTPRQWQDIFHSQFPPRLAWIACKESTGDSAGFLVAQCGSPEWELENLAVLPHYRRQGIGAALLSALLAQARARQAERVLLEVRVSNLSAIRLYGQGGFQLLARRPGYYQNPEEDALLFEHLL